jgi:hypothetical protein
MNHHVSVSNLLCCRRSHTDLLRVTTNELGSDTAMCGSDQRIPQHPINPRLRIADERSHMSQEWVIYDEEEACVYGDLAFVHLPCHWLMANP